MILSYVFIDLNCFLRWAMWPMGLLLTWLCVLWHSHTLFDKWVYHHGTMCRIHSWPLYDLDLWPQNQKYIFTMNLRLGNIVFALWRRLLNLAHGCITMWQKVVQIHDLCIRMTLVFDLYVGGSGYPQWSLLTVLILFNIDCFQFQSSSI